VAKHPIQRVEIYLGYEDYSDRDQKLAALAVEIHIHAPTYCEDLKDLLPYCVF
jgi:hypothetical protein